MPNNIVVKYIPNLMTADGRRGLEFPYNRDLSIQFYLDESGFDISGMKVIVSGKVERDFTKRLQAGDELLVCPDIEFDPATWAMIVLVAKIITVVATVVFLAYSIFSYVTYKKPSMPTFNTQGQGMDESSPTYGWDGIQTIQEVGVPIPIVYGEHAVGGNIINQYISTDGDKHYLNMLIALCEGEISSISNITINENPIANFSGITTETRMGTNSQSAIANFEDLHATYTVNVNLLKDVPFTYTSTGMDIEGFDLQFTLAGLFQQSATDGAISEWSVTYTVAYKIHTDVSYTTYGSFTISAKNRTTLRRILSVRGLAAGHYDIKITRTSDDADFYHTGDLVWATVDEVTTGDLIYPNTALLGLKALATDQLSGATPDVICVVKGKLVSVPYVLNTEDPTPVEVAWADYYYDPLDVCWKAFLDETPLSWDGVTWVTRWCANPIWCIRDLLLNTRYGLGEYINTSQLNLAFFIEMAKYCDERVSDGSGGYEKRFRLDCVIDSPSKALDIVIQLCSAFRSYAFYSQDSIIIKIDKVESPVQLFGMGNIIQNTFQQSWKSAKDVVNVVEAQYMDKDLGYKQEVAVVCDETALNAGDPMRKRQIRVFATKKSYAIREARYCLYLSKYVNRSVVFRAGIDAIACQPGDVISVSHDVPQIGESGRVRVGSTDTLIKLDRTVVLDPSQSYQIMVRLSDDTLETRTVTDVSGSLTEVNVSPVFSEAPEAYSVYAFGITNAVKKDYRVMGIKRENKGEVEITAVEYNGSVYSDTAPAIPTNNLSALSVEIPAVTNLALTERIVLVKDGTIENVIDVWWRKPVLTSYQVRRYRKAKVYLSGDGMASWHFVGESTGEHFSIQGGIVDLQTYYVAVASVSEDDEEVLPAAAPNSSILVLGKTASPSDVVGFDVVQEGNMLRFSWNAVNDPDLGRYEIRKGGEWSLGTVIAEKTDTTEFMYPVGEVGLQYFMIKAVDRSGNYSDNPGLDSLTVIPPPEMNFINAFDLWQQYLPYKLSDLALIWAPYHDSSFARPCLALMTTDTWESKSAGYGTWEDWETAGINLDGACETAGYFEMTTPVDLETVFEFKVVVDASYRNVSGGSVSIEMSYSSDNLTYTSFATVSAATIYTARYIKFRVNLASDGVHNLYLYDLTLYINAPVTKVAWFRDQAVPVEGKTIIFGVNFTYPPRVIVTVVNGVVGLGVAQDKTKDQCKVFVYDPATKAAIGTGEVDVDAKGY